MPHRIILNETSYFGPGSRSVLPDEIKRRGFKKAFFVTDKELLKFGVAQKVLAVLDAAGIKGLTRSFIGTVAANGRARELVAMATAFLAELASRRGETTVAVTSAVPLSPDQLQQLNDSLRSVLGSAKVSIDARVEPEILGGLVVKVGSRLFDSSIRSKLQRLQLAMKGVA